MVQDSFKTTVAGESHPHLDDDEASPPRDQRLELKELVGLKLDGFSLLSGSRAIDLCLEDPIRSLDSTMMKHPRNTEDLTCKAINLFQCFVVFADLYKFRRFYK